MLNPTNPTAYFYMAQGAVNKIPVQLMSQKDLTAASKLRLRLSPGTGRETALDVVQPYDGSSTQLNIELTAEQSSIPAGAYDMQVQLLDASDNTVLLFPEIRGGAQMNVVALL